MDYLPLGDYGYGSTDSLKLWISVIRSGKRLFMLGKDIQK